MKSVWLRYLYFVLALFAAVPAHSATVLVLRFHNDSQYADLNWVGESVSETLQSEFGEANQIVIDRDARAAGMRRLSLRPDAEFTKATLIRLGQSLDADYLIYGSYDIKCPPGVELKNSSVELTAHFIDLRKLHGGPDVEEAGKLTDLARLEEHLAWQSLQLLDPQNKLAVDQFLNPQKLTRMDAQESYVRGLLSTNIDQQQKWFLQAANLDPHFASPAYELGKLLRQKKDYRQAISWLQRVPANDPRYPDARFSMGLSAYQTGDFNTAAGYFREVAKLYPLNEVYNNLGCAEAQLNQPAALDDFRRALDGDPNDAIYQFNLGAALLLKNSFDEAAKHLDAAVDRDSQDDEAQALLQQAQTRSSAPSGSKPLAAPRLKENFDMNAFRELKAMLSSKGAQ